ncbi:MAG: hypothetical protein HY593_01840 [Candidatus Omnitrophica bacterium]|nr:hypothetical protein [Candidatus Omnitrophota bacterium]
MRNREWDPGVNSFFISVVINAAVFFSFDRALLHEAQTDRLHAQALKLQQEKQTLQFEFVEAPPKVHPQKPAVTRKIASRDALNQDLARDKSGAETAPAVRNVGAADQLAQRKSEIPAAPSPPSPVSLPQKQASPDLSGEKGAAGRKETGKKEDRFYERRKKTPARRKESVSSQVSPQGLTGKDKITTEETAKARSRGAKLYGLVSFEATGSGMGQYMKNLKERVWLAWFPYLAFQYPQDFRGADAVIGFTLNKNGEVKIVRVVESRGSPVFAAYCMQAVQRASGFGGLPEEILALLGKEELEIKFGFHYR